MAQWYISIYSRLANKQVELISYSKAANFAVACSMEQINLPNNQFYHTENCVGSLMPKPKLCWVDREVYSHKPKTAQLQAEAEIKAVQIINADDVDFAEATATMKDIKGLLTKAQYDLVFKALMRKPSVMQYLYERSK